MSSISSSSSSCLPGAFCHVPIHHAISKSIGNGNGIQRGLGPSMSNSMSSHGRRRIPELNLNLNSISNHSNSIRPPFGQMDMDMDMNESQKSTCTNTRTIRKYRRNILGLGVSNVSASASSSSSQLFMTGKDKDSNTNDYNGSEDRDSEIYNDDDHEEYYHDDDGKFYNEEALLELLALDDLDELDADDLDVIGIDDLNELKELERMLNQQQQQGQQQGQSQASSWMSEEMIEEEEKDDKNNPTENEAAAMFSPPSTTTTNTNNIDSFIDPVSQTSSRSSSPSSSALEQALLQGVVPASAGVGSNCLPGDYGFDPLGFATKDYFKKAQIAILDILPGTGAGDAGTDTDTDTDIDIDIDTRQFPKGDDPGAALPKQTQLDYDNKMRPPALILRDYREIEIRHGRLAMLAALLWPIQEITDRLFIPELFGSTTMIYGGVTLPYVTLGMTAIMLLLGYLDIYAASIKENDAGDAFLPGECFWDPLSILDGTSETVKRNMQARELNNGRFAMIAVLSYILQESIMHQPLITLPWNQILFEPAFEIPAVQAWLDGQFAGAITGKGVIEQDILDGEVIKEVKVIIDGIGIVGENIDGGASSPNTSIDIAKDAAGIIEEGMRDVL